MIEKPLLADAILGNSRLLVTLTADMEVQRMFWPHIDGGQHVHRLLGGVSIDGGRVLWQDDDQWVCQQAYEPDQNVLTSTAELPGLLVIRAVDAATLSADVFIRQLTFTNLGEAPMALEYLQYNWIRVDENPLYNTGLFDPAGDCFMHFRRDNWLSMGADRPLNGLAVGKPDDVFAAATQPALFGGTVLHGDVATAGQWDLGSIAPGDSVQLSLFWALGGNGTQVRSLLQEARASGSAELLRQVRTHWSDWLSQGRELTVTESGSSGNTLPGLQVKATAHEVQELYRRSLLVFKLMSDEKTGAVIAAPEFDPAFTSCGGYAYCWGRDAAYITVAMDVAGYHKMARAFYEWAVRAQEPEGWWMHRHYATGDWAPSWGLVQIDETGSILYGMAVHARLHGGRSFASEVWPSVTRAADWLIANLDPENGLPVASVDLWEERTGQHTYSSAAVYGGLAAAAELAGFVGKAHEEARYREAADRLKQVILRECVYEKGFLRGRYLQIDAEKYSQAFGAEFGTRQRRDIKGYSIYELEQDRLPDTSLLGLAYPFGLVSAQDPTMARTARRLVESLWTEPTGGMRRYVADQYRGGTNPWILCTLWLGLYEAERGNLGLAREILDWAVARRTRTGLLAEQVDPQTGKAVWVVPLTWSHAMYVLLAQALYGNTKPLAAIAEAETFT